MRLPPPVVPAHLILIALIALLTHEPARAQESLAREHIDDGRIRAAEGDTTGALRAFIAAINADPDLADAYYYYGRFLSSIASSEETDFEMRQRAEQAIREAIDRDPDNPLYFTELGMILVKQGLRDDDHEVRIAAIISDHIAMPRDQGPVAQIDPRHDPEPEIEPFRMNLFD